MFDVFGPHGAEEEREALWTDLSEIPDEHYSEENPQHTTRRSRSPGAGAIRPGNRAARRKTEQGRAMLAPT